MSESYFLNCDTILVDRGDHNQRFNRGDELIDVPDGTMVGLVRRGLAVVAEMLEIPSEPDGPEEVQEAENSIAENLIPEWMEAPIADLYLPKAVAKSLDRAGIKTVGDIVQFGAAHQGTLTSIKGIGAACEQDIQAAITALQPQ